MELLIQLLPLILSTMNTVPQFEQAIHNGSPAMQAVGNLVQLGKQLFPGIDDKFAAAAAASTMFDPVRVKWVQTALNVLGEALDVDGQYGPLTTQAVKQFQTSNQLEVDGWAGDLTHAALQAAISALKLPAAPAPKK
jgi:murein L,D-transpeptidase YcbB/YkuD